MPKYLNRSERTADERIDQLKAIHARLRDFILQAQERQTRHAGGRDITFKEDDYVWLSTRNIKTLRPSIRSSTFDANP